MLNRPSYTKRDFVSKLPILKTTWEVPFGWRCSDSHVHPVELNPRRRAHLDRELLVGLAEMAQCFTNTPLGVRGAIYPSPKLTQGVHVLIPYNLAQGLRV